MISSGSDRTHCFIMRKQGNRQGTKALFDFCFCFCVLFLHADDYTMEGSTGGKYPSSYWFGLKSNGIGRAVRYTQCQCQLSMSIVNVSITVNINVLEINHVQGPLTPSFHHQACHPQSPNKTRSPNQQQQCGRREHRKPDRLPPPPYLLPIYYSSIGSSLTTRSHRRKSVSQSVTSCVADLVRIQVGGLVAIASKVFFFQRS